jgi:hypothetical protein
MHTTKRLMTLPLSGTGPTMGLTNLPGSFILCIGYISFRV